jgi:hypothetical protein
VGAGGIFGFVCRIDRLNRRSKGNGSDPTWFGRPLIKDLRCYHIVCQRHARDERRRRCLFLCFGFRSLSAAKEPLTKRSRAWASSWSLLLPSPDLGQQSPTHHKTLCSLPAMLFVLTPLIDQLIKSSSFSPLNTMSRSFLYEESPSHNVVIISAGVPLRSGEKRVTKHQELIEGLVSSRQWTLAQYSRRRLTRTRRVPATWWTS